MRKNVAAVSLFALVLVPTSTQATVIFDNSGGHLPGSGRSGLIVGGGVQPNFPLMQDLAQSFATPTLPAGARLRIDLIELAVNDISFNEQTTGGGPLTVSLWSDDGGLPGSVLGSAVRVFEANFNPEISLVPFDMNSFELLPDRIYWIMLSTNPGFGFGWYSALDAAPPRLR